jgi:hypothetical protein
MMIDLMMIVSKFVMRPLTAEERKQFQSELQCSISFGGLKPIWRVFI